MDPAIKAKAESAIAEANNNPFFYTMSPSLLVALTKSFKLLSEQGSPLLKNAGYYEFGLFKGFSFWFSGQLSQIYAGENFWHYGFDSFEGIGHSEVDGENPYWRKGAYASPLEFVVSKLKRWGVNPNTKLFKGYYSRELFDSIVAQNELLPAAIFTVDCDIYEGAILCLDFMLPRMRQGTIILFDDFDSLVLGSTDAHGERRAWKEFQEKNPSLKATPLFRFDKGAAFQVTAL